MHFVLVDLRDVLASYDHLLLIPSVQVRCLIGRDVPVVRRPAFNTVHTGSLSLFNRFYRLRIHGSQS